VDGRGMSWTTDTDINGKCSIYVGEESVVKIYLGWYKLSYEKTIFEDYICNRYGLLICAIEHHDYSEGRK
jgi:hypothetical protein